jgi:hypothetical protein
VPKQSFNGIRNRFAPPGKVPSTSENQLSISAKSTLREILPSGNTVSTAYRQPRPENPLKCRYCGNWRIESFDAIYSRGSSLSKYRRGLIFKTHWAQTRRQSVLAMRCAPPRKKSIWWTVGLALFAIALLRYVPTSIFGVALPDITLAAFILLAFGVLVSVYNAYWNQTTYPRELSLWESSFYCSRCGYTTVIHAR